MPDSTLSAINRFIESGILEMYVMGAASTEDMLLVQQMAAQHPEIRQEINAVSDAVGLYASADTVSPSLNVRPTIMATIDYMSRMESGEPASSPPKLTAESRAADYEEWLSREDMVLPEQEDILVKIIGFTPEVTTAIIWIRDKNSPEVHEKEHESILILEGSCDLMIGKQTLKLKAGDYLAIPLHTSHMATVTSHVPCKAIVQRVAVPG